MSDGYDGPQSAPKPQRVRAPKEPPKIPQGTWVQILPGEPELMTYGKVEMCLPRGRVEVRLRNGALLVVDRYLIRIPQPHGPRRG